MKKFIFLLFLAVMLCSCTTESHKHDGSYALNIQMFGANVNSEVDLIIKGDKMRYLGETLDCKQYADRVEIENGKMIFTSVDEDLVTNVQTLGKLRYLKISGKNNVKISK